MVADSSSHILSVLGLCAASSQWLQAMVKAHVLTHLPVLSNVCEVQGISDALQHINLPMYRHVCLICTYRMCHLQELIYSVYRLAFMFVHEMEASG